MARAPRICSVHGCPEMAVRLNRCRRHAAERDRRQERTTPTKRTRTWSERKRRAQAVARHRQRHGEWCPGYKRAPHPARDLTAEHIDPVAEGGAPDGPLTVWCRSCNSRHGAETRNLLAP